MKVKDFLTATNWTKLAYARDENGFTVSTESDEACKFCLAGALIHCYGSTPEGQAAYEKLSKLVLMPIETWNDLSIRKFEDVQQLLELADV